MTIENTVLRAASTLRRDEHHTYDHPQELVPADVLYFHRDADPCNASDDEDAVAEGEPAVHLGTATISSKRHSLRVMSTLDEQRVPLAAPPSLPRTSFAPSHVSSEYDMADPSE